MVKILTIYFGLNNWTPYFLSNKVFLQTRLEELHDSLKDHAHVLYIMIH